MKQEATVAVIGAGPAGLSMLKTLREDGFKATLYERRSQVGGLWAYSDDTTMTTALRSTEANISKYTCGFSDYPIPDKYPHYLSQAQFQEFLEGYAVHFDLLKDIVFKTLVKRVFRNDDDTKWVVEVEIDGKIQSVEYDKVSFCHGYQTKKNMPKFQGQEEFEGLLIHSQEYRDPETFAGKKVVVVGLGTTAGDIIGTLIPVASKVYASHRRGATIIRRIRNGTPLDLSITWRRRQINTFFQRNFPGTMKWIADAGIGWLIRQNWAEIDPAWRLSPYPSILITLPVVSDVIVPALKEGTLTSLHGVKRFTGPHSIEFDDGTVIDDVDAVVAATGYGADFTVAPFLETSKPPDYDGPELVRMWMNLFPPKYATSMALCCHSAFGKSNGFSFNDIIAMAISNVFRGAHAVPSEAEMERHVDEHQRWLAAKWRLDQHVSPSMVKQWEFQQFVHDAAGTGMENLGWGWKGWKFWLQDPKMSYLMNNGIETAHSYRYFETGKRRTWPGARNAIIHANKTIKVFPLKK
ncbi:putative dimethylaniline monooxygenase [Xylariales sp. PMI_506]|nr:putative dimethylaniline monooxygenase [Xylariales sp. PMI_506]